MLNYTTRIFLAIIILSKISYAEQLIKLNAKSYLDQNYSKEREIIVNSLTEQFIGKKVSKEDLDQLWQTNDKRIARFQIINQQVFANAHHLGQIYFPILLNYFQQLAKKYKLPDVDFIIYLTEQIVGEDNPDSLGMKVPAFIMFQDKNSKAEMNKFIFPDGYFLKKSWGDLFAKIKESRSKYKWEEKVNKLFWRGGATGGYYKISNFSKLDRIKLLIFSKTYPSITDAKFTDYFSQVTKDEEGKKIKEVIELLDGYQKEKVTEEDHLKYKYLVSVDGNAATGTRVPWIMLSNSVLVKQESNKIQWYYSALKPGFHYVPIKNDLTDIITQYRWLEENQPEIQSIINNANRFVENNLTSEDIESHAVILLNAYSKIQSDNQISVSLPPASEAMNTENLLKNLAFLIKAKIIRIWNGWFK